MSSKPTGRAPTHRQMIPWWVPQFRDVLALLSTLIFAGGLFVPAFKAGVVIDQDLKGAVVLQWGLVMGWYFGSSKASNQKDETIASLAKGEDQ
jgi:hypothetical protein